MTQLDLPATFRSSPTDEDGEPWLGYIRVSTWKEEQISPELQEGVLREWAARTGRRLLEPLIIDLDATGRNFKRRIMGAIERVEQGEARGIAVWRYSRFGRSRTGNVTNLARLEAAGGQLESATEHVDARTAIGRFQRDMIFAFGNYESDRAGEQWIETHDHRRNKLHLPSSGRPRWGYIWHPRRLPDGEGGWTTQKEWYEIHPERGPILADLYRDYADGRHGFETLAAWLNRHGHRTTTNRLWAESTIKHYMDSGFPAGLLRVHDRECNCERNKQGLRCPNYLMISGAHEECVAPDLWEAYQARRKTVRATPPRARQALYRLTGLMRHAECRGSATIVGTEGYAYRCSVQAKTGGTGCKGIRETRAHVEREVLKWVLREAAAGVDAAPSVPQQRAIVLDERTQAARERARLQAELAKYDDGLARLQADRAVNPDDYPPGAYEKARDRIKQQQATTRAALDKCIEVEQTPDRSDYEPLIISLAAEWETLKVAEQNALLKQLIRRVVLERIDPTDEEVEGGEDRRATAKVHIHPVWEPDPWEDKQVKKQAKE
ncbi:resolvase, N domain protein [Streptomyces himastatinicus ATCC 53653]|uniref:Resolvase, N domain protein n=1 Tax=Streptomyces himastatinicus ATCC 53653 TaxID=457427 RepID=D9WPJ8_9ACTN|nr:recombinase family protein [Streptomyces himastatinicus]EFL21863.1 resolvase, N domain protein [Streptomyces himastatinicus ATCC 53653]